MVVNAANPPERDSRVEGVSKVKVKAPPNIDLLIATTKAGTLFSPVNQIENYYI
jgi:hypothetical protein